MRQGTIALLTGALLMGLAGPASAQARGRDADHGWWPWAGGRWEQREDAKAARKAGRSNDDRWDDREDRGERARGRRGPEGRGRQGRGPKFCQNGQGHPVHGMEWCADKGWAEASWRDVIFRGPLPYDRRLEQPTLGDILGGVILGRLTDYASGLGVRGGLDGRLLDLGRGAVLQVRAGGLPLAELTDRDGDGRVDLVLLTPRG